MIRVLDILEDYLYQMNMNFERLDGRIRGNDRQAAIDRFSKPGEYFWMSILTVILSCDSYEMI